MSIDYQYTEQDVENALKRFPKEFLGRDFRFITQQLPLFNLRPDLVFRNEKNQIVLVEIQKGSLDFNHIYKILGYKDLYEYKYSNKQIEILLVVCGGVAPREDIVLRKRGIPYIVFSDVEFVTKAKRLGIKLPRKTPFLSVESLLHAISQSNSNNCLNIEALVFYTAGECSCPRYIDEYTQNLRAIKKYPPRWHKVFARELPPCKVPLEIIISPQILNTTFEQVLRVSTILEFVTKYARVRRKDETIILGYRTIEDHFGFERYLEGRKLLFSELCRMYANSMRTWDFELIEKDLNYLASLKIYCGKYPNFIPQPIFESFNISQGLGEIEGNWEKLLEEVSLYSPDQVQSLQSCHEALYTEPFWVLTFKCFDYELAQLFLFMFRMLLFNYASKTVEVQQLKRDNRFLILPKPLKNIPRSILRLTSRYFIHYDVSNSESMKDLFLRVCIFC